MFKLICAFLLITFAFADKGFYVYSGSLDRSKTKCFARSDYSLIALKILNNNNNDLVPSSYFLNNYINALDAGVQIVDAYFSVSDKETPEETCDLLLNSLPPSFDQIVWLEVADNGWKRERSKRIDFLEDISISCSSKGIKVGIFSSALEWTSVMGSQGAGSDTLRKLPLWYQNRNGAADFNDFRYAGFGGWKSPIMKEYDFESQCSQHHSLLFYVNRSSAFLGKK